MEGFSDSSSSGEGDQHDPVQNFVSMMTGLAASYRPSATRRATLPMIQPAILQRIEPGAVDYSLLFELGPLNRQSGNTAWYTTYYVGDGSIHVIRGQEVVLADILRTLMDWDDADAEWWAVTSWVPNPFAGEPVGGDRWLIAGTIRVRTGSETESVEQTESGTETERSGSSP